MTIWGNHSATQYPDLFHAEVGGKTAAERHRRPGLDRGRLHPDRAAAGRGHHRGPGPLERRLGGQRRHRPRAHLGGRHADGDWVSMAIPTDGSYGVPEGLHVVVPGAPPRAASTRSSRASTSTTSPAAGSTPRWPSWPRSATPSPSSASSERRRPNSSLSRSIRSVANFDRLLEELAGGVVGQHLAAGLAGGAVVDRVAARTRPRGRCRRRPGRSRRCGGARRRAAPWTSSCRRGCARRRATRRCTASWMAACEAADLVRASASPRWRTARAWPCGRSRWPGGDRCRPWRAGRGGGRAGASSGADADRPAPAASRPVGIGSEAGEWAPGPRPAAPSTHPHAGPLLGARPRSAAAPARRRRPSGPGRRGAWRLLVVGLQPAALHEVDDERRRRRSPAAGTCPADRRRQSVRRRPASGAGRRSSAR